MLWLVNNIANALLLLKQVNISSLSALDQTKFEKAFDAVLDLRLLNAKPATLADGEWAASLTAGNVLVVGVPDGWDDVKGLSGRVLLFEGNRYAFSGWNSDRNEAYFKPAQSVATTY